MRSFIQSVYPIGCLIGVLCFSVLSDIKGRRFSFLMACFAGAMGTYLLYYGILTHDVRYMVLGQLGKGMYSSACATMSYIMTG